MAKARKSAGKKPAAKGIRGKPWKPPKGACCTFAVGDGKTGKVSWCVEL